MSSLPPERPHATFACRSSVRSMCVSTNRPASAIAARASGRNAWPANARAGERLGRRRRRGPARCGYFDGCLPREARQQCRPIGALGSTMGGVSGSARRTKSLTLNVRILSAPAVSAAMTCAASKMAPDERPRRQHRSRARRAPSAVKEAVSKCPITLPAIACASPGPLSGLHLQVGATCPSEPVDTYASET
jgi:hypothetical protein